MSKLVDAYSGLIKAAGMLVTLDGSVSVRTESGSAPFEVTKKRVVLPTDEQLRNPDWNTRLLFNPLSENFARGETPLMTRYRRMLAWRLEAVLTTILGWQIATAGAKGGELVKSLSPAQAAFTAVMDGQVAKYATLATKFQKVIDNTKASDTFFWFLQMNMSKNGVVNGIKNNRCCIVTFPFYESLLEGEDKLHGVTFNKSEVKTLIDLFQFVIPGIGTVVYDHGSMSMTAPTIDALMGAARKLGVVTDGLQDLYKDYYDDSDRVLRTEWTEVFDDLSVVAKEVRALGDTSGSIHDDGKQTVMMGQTTETVPSMKVPSAAPSFPQAAVAQPQQVMTPAPVPPIDQQSNTGRKMTFAEAEARRLQQATPGMMHAVPQQAVFQQPMVVQPTMLPGWGGAVQQPQYAVNAMGQTVMVQPQPQQAVLPGWERTIAKDMYNNTYGFANPNQVGANMMYQGNPAFIPQQQFIQQPVVQYDMYNRPIQPQPQFVQQQYGTVMTQPAPTPYTL